MELLPHLCWLRNGMVRLMRTMHALRPMKHPPDIFFRRIKPDYMLLTNLFRDQLDRYGEIDITMNILEEMMRKVPEMQIIVNGDDALSAYLAMDTGKSLCNLWYQ